MRLNALCVWATPLPSKWVFYKFVILLSSCRHVIDLELEQVNPWWDYDDCQTNILKYFKIEMKTYQIYRSISKFKKNVFFRGDKCSRQPNNLESQIFFVDFHHFRVIWKLAKHTKLFFCSIFPSFFECFCYCFQN